MTVSITLRKVYTNSIVGTQSIGFDINSVPFTPSFSVDYCTTYYLDFVVQSYEVNGTPYNTISKSKLYRVSFTTPEPDFALETPVNQGIKYSSGSNYYHITTSFNNTIGGNVTYNAFIGTNRIPSETVGNDINSQFSSSSRESYVLASLFLPGNTYYYVVRISYVCGDGNTIILYSDPLAISIPAPATAPTVTTNDISDVTGDSGTSGGNVTSDGGATVTERGVVWARTSNPTISLSSKTSDGNGTGSFISSINGLIPNTTYFVRAYAKNSSGLTGYGDQKVFSTCSYGFSNQILSKGAGTIYVSIYGISGSGYPIIDRGVLVSTDPNISVENFSSSNSIKEIQRPSPDFGTSDYSLTFRGLQTGRKYYVISFVRTCAGYSYNRGGSIDI